MNLPLCLGDVHLTTAGSDHDLAVVDAERRVSYGDLDCLTRSIAANLRLRGVGPGDRVAVRYGNSADFVLSHLGVLRSGAVSVPMPIDASPDQTSFMLTDTEASLVIGRDMGEGGNVRTLAVDDLTASGVADVGPVKDSSLATLMYTTGTSGPPKAVMLTHANTLAALRNILAIVRPDRERELITLPIHHSFGLGQIYATLASRGTVFLSGGLARLRSVIETIAREEITAMPGTPSTFRLLLDRGGARFVEAASSLRLSVINSSPLPMALALELKQRFPRTRFIVYYGLTEASRSTFLDLGTVQGQRNLSVGLPAPGVRVSVVNPNGTPAPPGERGEIVISGAPVASGYWRRSQETADAFREGHLFTGDIGTIDQGGFIFVHGRTKDTINVGGNKVAPSEVEAVLGDHSSVDECAVVGVEDPVSGERVVAAVVLSPGAEIDPAALAALCASRLQAFQVPRQFISVPAIPKTPTGKILRESVRRMIETEAC